ncbi:MAG: type I-MYXAN CRISPR-associated protein Cmx8 [Proteobacteria bacterium]|nr:type I-MYXAN CRISPR-associated protein Cmx8 [Pseudomonadota bacterium]
MTATSAADSDILSIEYTLDELPSSQHRAGLAGLVLMSRWLNRQPKGRGLCQITLSDPRSVQVRMDRRGLTALFDQVYSAELEEVAYPRPFAKKPPKRTEERDEIDTRTKKKKTKTVHIYDLVVPKGAYLEEWDPGEQNRIWLKLWRDMVWSILRGVPATRAPFEARAHNKPDKLLPDTWRDLARKNATVELPSTYYLGAQAKTAENVPFRDLARWQFLLHFWPFVAAIYVPATIDNEGKRSFRGYAIAVPDVADINLFCDIFEETMRYQRSGTATGYVPAEAVIDLAAEGGLDFLARLISRVQQKQEHYRGEGDGSFWLVYGIDVFHVAKDGNNVRVLTTARIDAECDVGEFQRIRQVYRNSLFRRQRLLNFFASQTGATRPWYSGYDRLLCTTPVALTIGSSWFRTDARRALTEMESPETEPINTETAQPNGDIMAEPNRENSQASDLEFSLQSLIYRIIRNYINGKLKSRHDQKWDDVKSLDENHAERKSYHENRLKIAKEAFFAARSRTGSEFIDYFSGTLCSVPYKLGEETYAALTRTLLAAPDTVRTLTLLALSAQA